jgi:hypothetical protein
MCAGEKIKRSELDLVISRAGEMELSLKIVRAILGRSFGVNIEGSCM